MSIYVYTACVLGVVAAVPAVLYTQEPLLLGEGPAAVAFSEYYKLGLVPAEDAGHRRYLHAWIYQYFVPVISNSDGDMLDDSL